MLKKLALGILASFVSATLVFGQASLLPDAKQQFFNPSGVPLASGTVDFYVPNTGTRKNTWTNSTESSLNTNPVVLDSAGRAVIYGQGAYRQVVKDAAGNTQWDAVTTSPLTTTSTFVTDAAPVGTMLPYSGLSLPTNYLWAYGQQLNRTTYATLMNAITSLQTVTTISSTTTLSGFTDTTQFKVGANIEGACLSAGTTISTVATTSITVSAVATSTGVCSVRVFPFGNGNGATTFTAPDMRGRVPAGRDNLGGTAANVITSGFCPTVGVVSLGQSCGSQSHTMLLTELAIHNHISPALTDPGHTHVVSIGQLSFTLVGTAGFAPSGVSPTSSGISVASATTGITLAATTGSTGANSPIPILQPTTIVNYIIKYQESTPSGASGVISLGGMSGDIACGAGVTCASQTISINPGVGLGDVLGPVSSTGGHIACWNNTTGTLLSDCGNGNSVVRMQSTATGWSAYGPGNTFICSETTVANITACLASAAAIAFPTSSAVKGYDFLIEGGNANDLILDVGGWVVPSIQVGTISALGVTIQGGVTTSASANESVLFDSCEICTINLGQVAAALSTDGTASGNALHFKPRSALPIDPNRSIVSSVVNATSASGKVWFDLSGAPNVAGNGINNYTLNLFELNAFGNLLPAGGYMPLTGCVFKVDTPSATHLNMAFNQVNVSYIWNMGSGQIALCEGNGALPGGFDGIFGYNTYNIGIQGTPGQTVNGVDTYGSHNIWHVRAYQLDHTLVGQYTFKLESGACNNIVNITTDETLPTVTDSSGCTGANSNIIYVNGTIRGIRTITAAASSDLTITGATGQAININAGGSGGNITMGVNGSTANYAWNAAAYFPNVDGATGLGDASKRWKGIYAAPTVFASAPACGATIEGATWSVTDSSTVTWGATITGGSTNHVLGYCNGTNWTVAAK